MSTEITYAIPVSAAQKFKSFFQQLDKDLPKLAIHSYGVSITTLEDVFLTIGHGSKKESELEELKLKGKSISAEDKILNAYSVGQVHERNFITQVGALMRRKVLTLTRDRRGFLIDFLFPMFLIVFGLYLTTVELVSDNMPRRLVMPEGFPHG